MKVYLLKVGPEAEGGRLFYVDPISDVDSEPLPTHPGLRGWFESRFRKLKTGWEHSEGRAVRLFRDIWLWLRKHTHPDETLLTRLRTAGSIEVHHPATMKPEEVLTAWSAFLAKGRKRHWPWFLVNLFVSPLTVLLAPIPGPNLIGYWIAYRAIQHGLILLGLKQARSGRIETHLKPEEELNRPITATATDGDVPKECDPTALEEFLRRQGARPS